MKSLLLFILLFSSLTVNAGCLDGLKDLLGGSFISKELLDNIERVYDYREVKLKEELDEVIKSTSNPPGSALRLREYLDKVETNSDRRMLLEMIPSIYMDSTLIKEWSSDLMKDIVRDLVVEGNLTEVQRIAWEGIVKEELILKALKERLIEAGLKDIQFIEANEILTPEVFGEILQEGNLILDRFFQEDSHGPLIHPWQLDLIRFSAKKRGLDPESVGELYRWMGENKLEALPSGNVFEPLSHVWDVIFDLSLRGLACPEVLNPIIAEYFGK